MHSPVLTGPESGSVAHGSVLIRVPGQTACRSRPLHCPSDLARITFISRIAKLSSPPRFLPYRPVQRAHPQQLGKLRPIVNRPDAALAPDGGGSQPPRRLPACPTSRQRFHFYVVHPLPGGAPDSGVANRRAGCQPAASLPHITPAAPHDVLRCWQIGIVAVSDMNRSLMFVLAAAGLWSAAVSADQAGRWQIEPFARPSGSSPVIAPNKASLFRNPVDGKRVHWEALHTFNPAAMVRNGKIYVLYRAEDDTGEMGIGLHTSRLGLAESGDGIHFT